ncbi:hypothetical protein B0H67DRAFT_570314 [Lasiosphaeris hirsuta]|uniref:Uncharacterized protein n=1 Tax=Lasiosphaeris hirsuta TaxID=260670 RepID=A0AA40B0C6_9PEZI|nr:hypothetical protein B0H67DRAFT_570314 [Lasiosphaeris hirsuta]
MSWPCRSQGIHFRAIARKVSLTRRPACFCAVTATTVSWSLRFWIQGQKSVANIPPKPLAQLSTRHVPAAANLSAEEPQSGDITILLCNKLLMASRRHPIHS